MSIELEKGLVIIINIYFPADGYIDKYQSTLSELEDLVSRSYSHPIIIVGDFNAHLGDVALLTHKDSR